MSIQALRKSPEPPAATPRWRALLGQIGPQLAEEGRRCDRANEFVGANMAMLREHGFLELGVPAELGGAGLSRTELSAMLRELAHYCGSTALALAMHTHVAAAAAWRWRHQKAPTDGLLKRVAAERIQLLSSGGSDWLLGSGKAVKVDGGYQVHACKVFASGAPAANLFMTGAIEEDAPDGPAVLQFGVPMNAQGVSIIETWDTLGMRGTGSHDVLLDGVFVPDAAIGARRKPGVWHPLMHIVALVAMPLVYSVYAGIAEAARNLAVEALAKRRERAVIAALGALDTELAARRMRAKAWLPSPRRRSPARRPPTRSSSTVRWSAATRSGPSIWRSTPWAAPAISAGSVSNGCSATCRARAFIPCRKGRSASSRAAWRSVCRSTDKSSGSCPGQASALAAWVGHAAAREREPGPRSNTTVAPGSGSRFARPGH